MLQQKLECLFYTCEFDSHCACGCPGPMRCNVIQGDNAYLLTGFIHVEAPQCWCTHSCVNGLNVLMCSGKHWNVYSIHVILISTVTVDALAPWGAMSSTVAMLISKLDLFLYRGIRMLMCCGKHWNVSSIHGIWSSLCSCMSWPHEVPCHPQWQCWTLDWI